MIFPVFFLSFYPQMKMFLKLYVRNVDLHGLKHFHICGVNTVPVCTCIPVLPCTPGQNPFVIYSIDLPLLQFPHISDNWISCQGYEWIYTCMRTSYKNSCPGQDPVVRSSKYEDLHLSDLYCFRKNVASVECPVSFIFSDYRGTTSDMFSKINAHF